MRQNALFSFFCEFLSDFKFLENWNNSLESYRLKTIFKRVGSTLPPLDRPLLFIWRCNQADLMQRYFSCGKHWLAMFIKYVAKSSEISSRFSACGFIYYTGKSWWWIFRVHRRFFDEKVIQYRKRTIDTVWSLMWKVARWSLSSKRVSAKVWLDYDSNMTICRFHDKLGMILLMCSSQ